jgi:hypothetical protein
VQDRGERPRAGIDAERVERFARFASAGDPRGRIWTPREIAHARALPEPALALCAAFCCKEALYKALGGAYRFPAFEVLHDPGRLWQPVEAAPGLLGARGPSGARALVLPDVRDERGEILAVVLLSPPPRHLRIRSVPVSAGAAARDAAGGAAFTAGDVAALAGKPPQSAAATLAVKLALLALWEVFAPGVPAGPADFVIARAASGAPTLAASPPWPGGILPAVSISHTRSWAYGLAAL